jgi:hypothetical protein
MFVVRQGEPGSDGLLLEGGKAVCKCGCVSRDAGSRLVYSAPTTGAVKRHLELHHAPLLALYNSCVSAQANWNGLVAEVERVDTSTLEKIKRRRTNSEKLFKRYNDGLTAPVRGELLLMMWSAANAVPRHVLNCPLFDLFLKELGALTAPNRHGMQDIDLPVLDSLVAADHFERLARALAVSLSVDGYRDRVRRDWIGLTLYFIEVIALKWRIAVIHPDLIPVSISTTSEAIEGLVFDAVDAIVRSFLSSRSPLSSCLRTA